MHTKNMKNEKTYLLQNHDQLQADLSKNTATTFC